MSTITAERSQPLDETAVRSSGGRVDLVVVAEMVARGSRVLDVGAGDGELLELLATTRGCDARGIELSREGVNAGVARGLAVVQGDADVDLAHYPDDAFDYVILSQTLQATRRPRWVMEQMLRIGRHAVVSFPNFGHWRSRLDLVLHGRMPLTDNMPIPWYETPNIHFCTVRDFVELVDVLGARMEKAVALDSSGHRVRFNMPWWVWNLLGEQAVFLLTRKG
ncbi:methionine biosynthesis protein MetW [Aquabacter sp. CN5-332]|uniref:methionine biosynthesis protein MetW n=1 Tax=Aquabacter sp. CN5-332 TaxID=3156608 RepID=UPI0032B5A2CE